MFKYSFVFIIIAITIITGIRESLRNGKEFICKICSTVAGTDDPFSTCIAIDRDEFETVTEFSYLDDVIGQARGHIEAVTTRIRSSWKDFLELLLILMSRGISLWNREKVFKVCVRSLLLYGSAGLQKLAPHA